MKATFGSRLYGTSTPQSDTDLKSIHIPSSRDILLQNARGVLSSGTKTEKNGKNTAEDVDDESFALFKFKSMLVSGDLVASEVLFIPDQFILQNSEEWEFIRTNKHRLLSRKIKGFVGYCQRQANVYSNKGARVASIRVAVDNIAAWLEETTPTTKLGTFADRIEKITSETEYMEVDKVTLVNGSVIPHWVVCNRKLPYTVALEDVLPVVQKVLDDYGHRAKQAETNLGLDWKAISHAQRISEEAIELLKTETITFPRPNALELLDVKLGKVPYEIVSDRLDRALARIEEEALKSNLPDDPDTGFMDDLVCRFYRKSVLAG